MHMTELKVVDKLNQILIIVHGLRVLYQFWTHGQRILFESFLISECTVSSV